MTMIARMAAVVWLLLSLAMIGMIVFYAVSFWAMGQSRERTACYQHQPPIACPKPSWIENVLWQMLGHDQARRSFDRVSPKLGENHE